MPFTPLHFGPALLIFSLFLLLDPIAFFLSSVAVDIEGVLGLFLGRDLLLRDCGSSCVLHGPLHSIIGGTLVALLLAIVLILASKKIPKNLKKLFLVRDEKTILLSSFLGVYSHLFLDSFLYPEMNLAWPFGKWNPLLGALGYFEIYGFCALSFVLGTALLLMRKIKK